MKKPPLAAHRLAVVRLRFALLLVIVLLTNLLVACGTNQTTPTPATTTRVAATNTPALASSAAVANPVTITWSFWGDDAEIAINKRIIAQFEATNPNIRVRIKNEKWENYFTRLDTEWIGANAPDVMFLTYIPTYASRGILEDLTPYIKADKNFKVEDFYPRLLDFFKYNGVQYGLPRDNDTKVLYVNLDMLKEAGLSVPQAGWTWQDLLQYARKLTKTDASGNVTRYGFAFEPNEWWKLWVWQNGGEVYDNFSPPQPPARLLLNTPEAAGGVQFFADLINKEKVAPPFETMSSGDKITEMFAQGKVAMAFGNHTVVPTYSQTTNLKWDVAPLPKGKQRVNVLGGAGYVIHKDSKFKTEAWQFLRFLTGDLGQSLFADTGVMVAARQSVREDSIFLRSQRFNVDVFLNETKLPDNRLYPQFQNSNKIDQEMDKALEAVWRGKATAAEVFAALPAKVEPLFAEAKR